MILTRNCRVANGQVLHHLQNPALLEGLVNHSVVLENPAVMVNPLPFSIRSESKKKRKIGKYILCIQSKREKEHVWRVL